MRFLSPEWLTAMDLALSASPEVVAATADSSLRLAQVVTGTPDGDVAYLVRIERGRVGVEPVPAGEPADVTLTADWATAVDIATGALATHDAFTAGRLLVRGDIAALRAAAPALAGLGDAFESLRADTTYD